MKNFNFLETREVIFGSNIVRRFTFKTTSLQDSYALLAVQNRQLAIDFSVLQVESALFQKKDCFECLSPHEIAV